MPAELEAKSGKLVVSRSNYLSTPVTGEALENGAEGKQPIKGKAIARAKKPASDKT